MSVEGCDLCGDWPVTLGGKCHPLAPLRVEMDDEGALTFYCYIPECSRVVARFKGATLIEGVLH